MFFCLYKRWPLGFWILVIGWIGMVECSQNPERVCEEGLWNCTVEAMLPYVMSDTEKAISVAKSTSLDDHCRVWLEASQCNREKFHSGECSGELPSNVQQIIVVLSLVDSLANYSCKENFIKMERNFRCFLDTSLFQVILESCKDVPLNETNACDLIPAVTECVSKGIASKCGVEAEQIAKEIGPWFWQDAFQYIYQKKCPSRPVNTPPLRPTLQKDQQEIVEAKKANSEECGEALRTCLAPAVERYEGKDFTEAFEEIRNTPIRTHCSDWNTAVGCFRQVVYSDVCEAERENTDPNELEKFFEIYDWFSNYICVEHVDKVDRSFRCVVSLELFSEFVSSCADDIEDTNDPCVINANREKIAQCAYGVVTETCGAEATSVVRGLTQKLYELMDVSIKDKCETSNRQRQLAVLKNILRRL